MRTSFIARYCEHIRAKEAGNIRGTDIDGVYKADQFESVDKAIDNEPGNTGWVLAYKNYDDENICFLNKDRSCMEECNEINFASTEGIQKNDSNLVLQSDEQRDMLRQYGDALYVDGTHRVTHFGAEIKLLCLCVRVWSYKEECFKAFPVCFIIGRECESTYEAGFRAIRQRFEHDGLSFDFPFVLVSDLFEGPINGFKYAFGDIFGVRGPLCDYGVRGTLCNKSQNSLDVNV